MATTRMVLVGVFIASLGACKQVAKGVVVDPSRDDVLSSITRVDNIITNVSAKSLPIVRAIPQDNVAIAAGVVDAGDYRVATAVPIIESAVTSTGFARGDGSPESPLLIEQLSAPPQLVVSYSNSGDAGATNFSTEVTALPAGWRVTNHGCDHVILQGDITCTDTFALETSLAGRADFDVGRVVTASWNSRGRTVATRRISGVTAVFTTVVARASIAVNASSSRVVVGDSLDLDVVLTGGIDVPQQTVEFNNIEPYDAGFTHTGPCVVSSDQPQCRITIDVASTVPDGSYTAYTEHDGDVDVSAGATSFAVADF